MYILSVPGNVVFVQVYVGTLSDCYIYFQKCFYSYLVTPGTPWPYPINDALFASYISSLRMYISFNLPYSGKISRVAIFVDWGL